MHRFLLLALLGCASSFTSTAYALPMVIQPVAVTATSQFSGTRAPINTINDSGLSGLLPTGSSIPGVWPTHNNVPDGFMWHSASSTTLPSITFDLGAVYSELEGFRVWNFNENSGNPAVYTNRGFRDVTVSFSNVSAAGPFINPITYTGASEFIKADGTNNWLGEDKLFGGFQSARWIKFEALTRWGGVVSDPGGFYTGLSEVRFFTGLPAPEPTSWFLLSLGTLGLVRHTRRRNKNEHVSVQELPRVRLRASQV